MIIIKIIKKIKSKYTTILEKLNHKHFLKINKDLQTADTIFTHLTTSEKRKLFNLAKFVSTDGFALEIGSYLGASSCFIAAGLRKNAKLICIDTWENDAMSEGKRETLKDFEKNTIKYKDKIIKIRGCSSDVVDMVKKITNSIDLLFIDGDHSYQGCKTDWDLYSYFLRSGSCVIFHDIGWAEGVVKVIEEGVKPKLSSFEALPNMFWGYIK